MAELPPIVLDASVVVKWYLSGEEGASAAVAFQDEFLASRLQITMPDMVRYEVANAVNVARRRGRIGEDDARQSIADFLSWDFTYVGTDDLILAAVDVARRFDCALYDALYLALADLLRCDFVTADRNLFDKTRSAAPWVTWLGDDSSPATTRVRSWR